MQVTQMAAKRQQPHQCNRGRKPRRNRKEGLRVAPRSTETEARLSWGRQAGGSADPGVRWTHTVGGPPLPAQPDQHLAVRAGSSPLRLSTPHPDLSQQDNLSWQGLGSECIQAVGTLPTTGYLLTGLSVNTYFLITYVGLYCFPIISEDTSDQWKFQLITVACTPIEAQWKLIYKFNLRTSSLFLAINFH